MAVALPPRGVMYCLTRLMAGFGQSHYVLDAP